LAQDFLVQDKKFLNSKKLIVRSFKSHPVLPFPFSPPIFELACLQALSYVFLETSIYIIPAIFLVIFTKARFLQKLELAQLNNIIVSLYFVLHTLIS
jgi:hypothetical protein